MSSPSFISAAYVQQLLEVEMWVVCVYGQIFSVQTNRDTANILLKHVVSTDLENQHFVKVDNLFYYFRVGNMGKSIEPSIITYLPQFECLRILTGAHVSAVYSVIVIPSLDLLDVQSSYTVTIPTDERSLTNERIYENNPSNATTHSVSNDDIAVLKKVLRLEVYSANYIKHSQGFPAKPLYDRSGESVLPGTPSPHVQNARAQSPYSLLPRYTVSLHNITLNRSLGLPFAYGRYERIGTECIFQHHRTEDRNRTSKPNPCLEKIPMDLTVSGSECNEESVIDGIYTYNNLSESTPVYVKRESNIQRYMYYSNIGSNIGWRISRVLTYDHVSGQTKLL
jgi:hypothetical protein